MRAVPLLMLAFLGQLVTSGPLRAQDRLLPVFTFQKVSGLSNSQARSRVVRDAEGFVWIGTINGLARFDGYGVREYRNSPDDPHTLASNLVKSLLIDRRLRLWVGTAPAGISLFDRATEKFYNLRPGSGDSVWSRTKVIWAILQDRNGNIWLASTGAGVVRMELPPELDTEISDSLLGRIRFTTYALGTPLNQGWDLAERSDGTIAVASDSGLVIIDPLSHSVSHLNDPSPAGRLLNGAVVACLRSDSTGVLWAGTETEGLFRIDWADRTVRNYRHVKGDALSVLSNDVQDIVVGEGGDLWLGTAEGVQLFSGQEGWGIPFLAAGFDFLERSALTYLSFDRSGTLWVGKFDGGVYWLSRKSRLLPHFALPEAGGTGPRRFDTIERDRNGNLWFTSVNMVYQIDMPSGRVIKAIDVFQGRKTTYGNRVSFIDRNGTFWYGTWGLGLYRIDLESGRVSSYGSVSELGTGRVVQGIAQATGDSLWIAAYGEGLKKFDPATGRFSDVPGLTKRNVWSVVPDSRGKVWLGSETHGVTLLDPSTGNLEALRHDPGDTNSVSRIDARWILEDQAGCMWIGAGTMVHRWDSATGSITRYPNRAMRKALFAQPRGVDAKGNVWVDFLYESTSVLDPATGLYAHFDPSDGASYVVADMLTLDDGRVVLVGSEGANIFHPDTLARERSAPPLVLSKVSINDRPIPLPRHQNGLSSISLSHSQNVLEFEFVAADIDAPGRVQYHYRLEGMEEEWVSAGDRRYVRYTNLSPGEYRFRVRAASLWNEWPEQEIALAMNIAPPWWRTAWAYVSYVLIVVGLFYAAYRLRLNQFHLRQQAEMEHFQAERLAEVDRLKSRFFSSVSHEFRTPLTLILGPVEQMLESDPERSLRAKLHLVKDNARKLLGLVNELLDLSRMESGMMRLQAARGDVVPFLRRIVMSFESWAERKRIALEFESEVGEAPGWFDAEKVEKILNNLISNSLKFTPEGGSVGVRVSRSVSTQSVKAKRGSQGEGPDSGRPEHEGEFLEVSVSDSGPGIPPEHLPHIFDRFYRVDETHKTEGSGIGLALTKELAELHHGTISVESTPGKGSVFIVVLPMSEGVYKPGELATGPTVLRQPAHTDERPAAPDRSPKPPVEAEEGKPIILVVEDNDDLRAYIRENLAAGYAVQEAGDGKEGLARALETIPDLVISDVMMPGMDGIELCRMLKKDVRTSHVPVILLTARAGTDSKIEGLEIGADDYVTKPFDLKELVARVRNLIEQRRDLRKKFSAGVVLKPGEVAVTSLDDALLKKAMETVERNMRNEDFDVDTLAREVCLSRTHLNRKLRALTNLSPGQFIRYLRLERARELLEKDAGAVAEVAFQAGFGNLSHFSVAFKERFGVLPTEVRQGRAIKNTPQA